MQKNTWIEFKSQYDTLAFQKKASIYWYDGVTWLVKEETVESVDAPKTSSWLPQGWDPANALFLGWNALGQTVLLNEESGKRFVRRGPRKWVEYASNFHNVDEALFLSKDTVKDVVKAWHYMELFKDPEDCLGWMVSMQSILKYVPTTKELESWFGECEFGINKKEELKRQIHYQPLSKASHSAFVPSGLFEFTKNALDAWKINHNSEGIDEYVSRETGVCGGLLSGEQVDAVGLAIASFEKESAFLLGDQTGLGKGRVLATLAMWAKKNNYIPVFFTERASLFHDFWRDIEDVSGDIDPFKNAFILHQSPKLTWPNGESWKNGLTVKDRAECVKNCEIPGFVDIVLTTYSQFNRSDEKKINFLKKIAPKALFIFDEAHNATGQSNVREAIQDFRKKSIGCIYSSATFGKDADHVSFYSDLIATPPYMHNLEQWLSMPDSEPLRMSVSQNLVNDGKMVRREQDLSELVYSQRVLPKESYGEVAYKADLFSKFTAGMLEVQRFLSENFLVDPKHKVDPSRLFGGRLYRLNRLMLMMLSLKFTTETAVELLRSGVKPVLVCETTLEQALLGSDDESVTIKNSWKSFADVLVYELNDLASGWVVPIGHKQESAFDARKDKFEKWIQDNFFDIEPSPIDAIKNKLRKSGLVVEEISGRSQHFNLDGESWNPYPVEDLRVQHVRNFNAGKIDCLIITMAGCSGISLHASKKFKDQRPRELVEWQIPRNVSGRVQFFGRVYRKDQVIPSSISTQILGLPSERRGHIWQARKMQKLFQFTIGQGDTSTFVNNTEDYLDHKDADFWGKWWLLAFPKLAQNMGIFPESSSRSVAWLDRIFSRLSLLPLEKQESVLNFWDEASPKIFQKDAASIDKIKVKSVQIGNGLSLECFISNKESMPKDGSFDKKKWIDQSTQWKLDNPYMAPILSKLEKMEIGSTIRWRDKSRRKTISGRITDVWLPPAPFNSFWRAASICVWSPELSESTWVQLSQLSGDESLLIDSRSFSVSAGMVAHNEFHRSQWVLIGPTARLMLWKTHHNVGTWDNADINRLWLPTSINQDRFNEMTWPIGKPTWAMRLALLNSNEEKVVAYDKNGKEIYFSYSTDNGGQYTLTWDEQAQISDGLIPSIPMRQKYGATRSLQNGRHAITVKKKDGASLIFHLAGRGVYFGADSNLKQKVIDWEFEGS